MKTIKKAGLFVKDESSGEFKGVNCLVGETGKSSYQYATENGYTGTEEEFSQTISDAIDTSEQIKLCQDQVSELKREFNNYIDGIQTFKIIPDSYVKRHNGGITGFAGWSRTDFVFCGNSGEVYIEVPDATDELTYNCFYSDTSAPNQEASMAVYISSFSLEIGLNRISVPDGANYFILSAATKDLQDMKIYTDDRILKEKLSADVEDVCRKVEKLYLFYHNAEQLRPSSWKDVQDIVRAGRAKDVFAIGDQIVTDWTIGGVEYEYPLNVVDFEDVELESGEIVPCMVLQSHYSPALMPFSAQQAFYVAEYEPLVAGTYHVTMGFNWNKTIITGKTYQFTLAHDLPVGGQLAGFYRACDISHEQWSVCSFSEPTTRIATETLSVTEGDAGVSLGTFTVEGSETLNSFHVVAYGSNVYYNSAIRQWLNSDADVNAWWKPMNKWDRPPYELTKNAGFLHGFSQDFLSVLLAGKVITKLSPLIPHNIAGVPEASYDKVFLPSKEEMFSVPTVLGEGHAWEYWQNVLGLTEPTLDRKTYPRYVPYALYNTTLPHASRWRTATLDYGCSAWYTMNTGNVYHHGAAVSAGCLPVFRIG